MGVADVLWWTAAGLAALAGSALAGWALFGDRARGRRRCPRCWYTLVSPQAGLRCSECGHEARKERHLHRARRRWRVAILGLLLVAGGLAGFSAHKIYREGWIKATPTVAYIALV